MSYSHLAGQDSFFSLIVLPLWLFSILPPKVLNILFPHKPFPSTHFLDLITFSLIQSLRGVLSEIFLYWGGLTSLFLLCFASKCLCYEFENSVMILIDSLFMIIPFGGVLHCRAVFIVAIVMWFLSLSGLTMFLLVIPLRVDVHISHGKDNFNHLDFWHFPPSVFRLLSLVSTQVFAFPRTILTSSQSWSQICRASLPSAAKLQNSSLCPTTLQ